MGLKEDIEQFIKDIRDPRKQKEMAKRNMEFQEKNRRWYEEMCRKVGIDPGTGKPL